VSATQPIPLGADNALPLEALAGQWRVAGGFVDLFVVRRIGGQLLGRREFLLRVEVGGGLCGTPAAAAEPELALLAVGDLDSRLEPAQDPAAAAEAWVLAVDETMRDPARGWTEHLATPGEADWPVGALLGCAGRQVVWATVLAGAAVTADGQDIGPGAPPRPITAATPLRLQQPSRLLLREAGELGDAELAAALVEHRAVLLRHAAVVLQARAEERAARILQRASAAQASMAEGLAGLAGLAAGSPAGESAGEPVWQALALVAAAVGQPLPSRPASVAAHLPVAERIAGYAIAAELRLRRVLLRDGWWQRDNGALLAVQTAGAVPVALLPSRGGYRLLDPVTQRPRPLDRAEAAKLEPEAWMLYRGFPASRVGLGGLLRFISGGLRRDRVRLVLLSLATALLGVAGPVAAGLLAGALIPRSDQPALLILGGGLLAAAIGAACLELTRSLLLQRIEGRFSLDTQAALFDRLLRLPVGFFRRYGAADLAARVLAVEHFRRTLSGAGLGGLLSGVLALANVAVMLACNVRLALLGVAVALVATVVSLWLCVRQVRRERSLAEHRGRAENMVLEAIGGVAKLKAAAAVERAFAVWARLYGRQHRDATAAQRLNNWQQVFGAGFLPSATAALFVVAATLNESLRLEAAQAAAWALAAAAPTPPPNIFGLGAWLAFASAFGQLMAGGNQMVQAVSSALAAVPLYARAKPILETPTESGHGSQHPGLLSGAIEFNRVSFGYSADSTPVLHELSFTVQPGEYVAVVGPSGSGKSTVLRLLLGFETPLSGALLYDGRSLATLDAAAVRRQVGVVLQNSRLQAGSILDNIGGGRPINLEDAWHAVQLAGLTREVRALPMGMYTMLQEGGTTLSGGQRQRLLIARALARRPRLLLLDEATSALDNRTQSVVAEAVSGLGLTRVVVAHRLSTIAMVDRVLVLNRGRLVQSGRFEQLLAEPGLFQELARRQLT
jgi:NHLM bacteriocin system ABC transporter ATP-binding protein